MSSEEDKWEIFSHSFLTITFPCLREYISISMYL